MPWASRRSIRYSDEAGDHMNLDDPDKHDFLLLRHPVQEESAFTPQALIEAVRAEKGMTSVTVPEVCVLEFDGDLTDQLVQSNAVERWKTWACFHTPMFALEVNGRPCGTVPRAIGGPFAVLVAEQLLASGAKVIVGLTSAGRVSQQLPIPSLVIATGAIRDEGTSYHYLLPADSVEAPMNLIPSLLAELGPLGLPVHCGMVWTTDAPYRETAQELKMYADQGVLAVEMQAASLFALASMRNAAIGVVAHVTNAIDHTGEPFDKGPQTDGIRILKVLCHAGLAIAS
jgi:uridine phosphorylase